MTLIFDRQAFLTSCGLLPYGNSNPPNPHGALTHFAAWQAVLKYSHEYMMHAAKHEIHQLNPHINHKGRADEIRVLEVRTHRELVSGLLHLMASVNVNDAIKRHSGYSYGHNTPMYKLSRAVLGATVVPTEAAFEKSKFKKIWDEVYIYATTDLALVELGLAGGLS